MIATEAQITEQAEGAVRLAQALADGTIIGSRYAAARRLSDMADTLATWIGDD